MSFDISCEWESNAKYSSSSLADEVRCVQNVTGLRNFTVHDVMRYLGQLHKGGIPFYLTRTDIHEGFSWINQQLGSPKNDPSAARNTISIVNLLFDVFDKDEDDKITLFEFATGLSVICGGSIKENFRTAFNILDQYRDEAKGISKGKKGKKSRCHRNIAIKDGYDAYCTVFRLLYQLYDEILARVGCDPDYYARALTLRAYHRHHKHHRRHGRHRTKKHTKDKKKFRSYINVSTFVHWYRNGIEHIICDVPMLVEDHYNGGGLHFGGGKTAGKGKGKRRSAHNDSDSSEDSDSTSGPLNRSKDLDGDGDVGHHHSMISMSDAIRILGLFRFTPSMMMQYVTDLCDEDGTLTEATLHQGVIKLIRKHYLTLPLMDRPLADHILQRLFVVFQIGSSAKCTFTDIACALLVFCGGSLARKARAAYSLYSKKAPSPTKRSQQSDNDAQQEGGITHEGICACLTAIFKIVSDLDPGHHFDSAASCSGIAAELATDIFKQFPEYGGPQGGLLPLEQFAEVFVAIMRKFDASIIDATSSATAAGGGGGGVDISGVYSEGVDTGDQDSTAAIGSSSSLAASTTTGGTGPYAAAADLDDLSRHSDSSEEYMQELARRRREYAAGVSMEGRANASEDDFDSEGEDSSSDEEEGAGHGQSAHHHHEHVYRHHGHHHHGHHHNQKGAAHAKGGATSAGDGYGAGAATADETAHVIAELAQARHILNLDGLSPHDLLDILSEYCPASGDSSGQLTSSSWLLVLSYLANLNGAKHDQFIGTTLLGRRLFAAFDVKSKGKNMVPYVHFAIGLGIVLCEPHHGEDGLEEKLLMAFTLLDTNNDSLVSVNELNQMVFCILSVMQVASPTASHKITRCGVDVECLSNALVSRVCRSEGLSLSRGDELSYKQLSAFANKCLGALEATAAV